MLTTLMLVTLPASVTARLNSSLNILRDWSRSMSGVQPIRTWKHDVKTFRPRLQSYHQVQFLRLLKAGRDVIM